MVLGGDARAAAVFAAGTMRRGFAMPAATSGTATTTRFYMPLLANPWVGTCPAGQKGLKPARLRSLPLEWSFGVRPGHRPLIRAPRFRVPGSSKALSGLPAGSTALKLLPLPPTPPASDAATRRAMQGNRRSDTAPELALRRLLHAGGLRFRKDYRIIAGPVGVRADIAFPRQRVAVFVDGCYWHGCPTHCRMPARNAEYWEAKIARNRARDERVFKALKAASWRVVRIWEHETPEQGTALVREMLSSS
jgi:DNA mismatch endonuclease, patch repair protein